MIPYFLLDQVNLGPIKLYTWGLFTGIGFSAGYLLFYYLAKKEGLAPTKIAGLALTIFAGAILGAKILAVATLPGAGWLDIFSAHSGAAFFGGLIGAIIFGWGYVKLVKLNLSPLNLPLEKGGAGGLNFWQIADLLVLPTALGIGIGRIGCILINDHQGAITNLPWGILWPDGLVRHPVAIYESLAGFGLFIIFWFLRGKLSINKNSGVIPAKAGIQSPEPGSRVKPGMTRKRNDGHLFLLFLIAYSVIRFLLDFTRVASGPLADPRWGILSVSQWIALGIFLISLALLNYKRKC